jgi:hypothetical protein
MVQHSYQMLLGEVQALHRVLQHQLVLQLVAALRGFARSVFGAKSD